MKLVVTGALGHIGSALIRQLPLHFPGAEIVMLDNMMTQRYGSLFNLPAVGRYQFVEADVRSAEFDSAAPRRACGHSSRRHHRCGWQFRSGERARSQ